MPSIPFTVKKLESLSVLSSGERTDYFDSMLNGRFGLRVSSSGKSKWVWFVLYRIGGLQRRYKIGNYIDLPLVDARESARDILHKISKGIDPAAERDKHRKAETFGELATVYLEGHAKINKRSWKEDERILNKDVLPPWKSKKAVNVSRYDVKDLLRQIQQRGAPVHANRVLALVRKIFNFGIDQDLVRSNPCLGVKRVVDERTRQRQRVLNFEEIRSVWRLLAGLRPEVAGYFKLRFLTAQRSTEVRTMEWAEVDTETGWWTIPASKSKNGLAHRVPLSPQVLAVLAELKATLPASRFVLPSPRSSDQPFVNVKDPFRQLKKKSGVDFQPRDIRRTVASHLTGQLGVPRFTVARILNHVESGVTGVYDRHSYDPEKRSALKTWADLLDRILRDEIENAVVVALRKQEATAFRIAESVG